MTNKHTNLWWGPPNNFSDRKHARKISWLELFYDLVYVAVIAQLTHHLAEHPTWQEATYSFLLFSLIFWSWVNGSQYYDLHGNDSIRTRLFTFFQMLAVAAVAVTIEDAYTGHYGGFIIALAVIQIIITYLWWSIGLYDRSHRVFNKFYTVSYVLALALLILSYFTNHTITTLLWVGALVLNLSPPLVGAKTIVRILKERGQVFSASESIVERFGLFTIIVLAESILGTISGMGEVKDNPLAWVAFMLGILISFLLWSLYFDMTSEQETKSGYRYLQWLIFLHYPLLCSLSIVGACIKVLLEDMEGHAHASVQWMFCIALAIIVCATVGIAAIMKEDEEDRAYIKPVSKILLGAGLIVIVVPVFTTHLTSIRFLAVISVILFVPVVVGIRSWVKFKFFSANVSEEQEQH